MNFSNLFGNKTKEPVPEYFLAVEIHESLIKTALWEILDGEPSVVNVGSYESWADEESLINGVDSSLEQAVKVISGEPKRVIFGFPDSWMDEEKIHPTKIKLVSRLCKELGLEPIGAVTINRAVAHFLKKRDGVPPTIILLELYTTKIALSYIYLGEVKTLEEVAKSGDLARDIEEGLTRMDLPNYPARFVLTNGSDLQDESQQITSYAWQDKLPFKHLPKVEPLPVDFSIKAIALVGGTEAVKFMGLEVKDDADSVETIQESPAPHASLRDSYSNRSNLNQDSSSDNLVIPDSNDTPTIEDHGFFYEEIDPPVTNQQTSSIAVEEEEIPEPPHPSPTIFDLQSESTEYIEPEEDQSTIIIPQKNLKVPKTFPKLKLPSFPKIKLPKLKNSAFGLLAIPLILIAGFVAYLFFGQAKIVLHFTPQNYTQSLSITLSPTPDTPSTLVVVSQKVQGAAKETIATTGQATVGDKATGKIALYNRSTAPLVLKAGAKISSENGKNIYSLTDAVTIASKSADLLSGSEVFGKVTGVTVTSTRIGAEYNMSKDSTFSVDDFSKTIAYAVAETDIAGGTSRAVNAVSKEDQEKLLAQATEKIKQITSTQVAQATPGKKSIPSSDLQITKKVFDKNVGDESTSLSLELEGSLESLVYNDADLFNLVQKELQSKLPPSTSIKQDSTSFKVDSLQKSSNVHQATISVSASLFPEIDEQKLKEYIKGKMVNNIRHFFEPIKGFTDAEIIITPPVPFITKILPLQNIQFELVGN